MRSFLQMKKKSKRGHKLPSQKFLLYRGFSLVELLVVVGILGILTAIATVAYQKYKDETKATWAKAEMGEISKLMNVARNHDGYYHQFIYQMGYQPKGTFYAVVGTAASRTDICCTKYPDPGEDPCVVSLGNMLGEPVYRSGWLYYNCKSGTNRFDAVQNIQICEDEDYSLSCQKDNEDMEAFETSDFSTCSITPTTWCDCETFMLGAVTPFGKKLTLNSQGTLCEEE